MNPRVERAVGRGGGGVGGGGDADVDDDDDDCVRVAAAGIMARCHSAVLLDTSGSTSMPPPPPPPRLVVCTTRPDEPLPPLEDEGRVGWWRGSRQNQKVKTLARIASVPTAWR